mgnify:FL=1
MIQNEREIRHEYVLQAVRQMMTAARTAPKGKGIDIIEVAMVTDEDINIGISLKKGNTELKDAINSVLTKMTKDDFSKMMDEAISVQPRAN